MSNENEQAIVREGEAARADDAAIDAVTDAECTAGPRFCWRAKCLFAMTGVIALAVVLVTIAGIGWWYYTQTQRLAMNVADAMGERTGLEVRVGHAEAGLDGVLTLESVYVRLPGVAGELGQMAQVRKIELSVEPWSVLFGSPRIEGLFVEGAEVWLADTEDRSGLLLLESLTRSPREPESPKRRGGGLNWLTMLPERLPNVEFSDFTIHRGRSVNDGFVSDFIHRINVTLLPEGLNGDEAEASGGEPPSSYEFRIDPFDRRVAMALAADEKPVGWTTTLTRSDEGFQIRCDGGRIEDLVAWLPDGWIDQAMHHPPAGRIESLTLGVAEDASGQPAISADMSMSDVAVGLGWNEIDAEVRVAEAALSFNGSKLVVRGSSAELLGDWGVLTFDVATGFEFPRLVDADAGANGGPVNSATSTESPTAADERAPIVRLTQLELATEPFELYRNAVFETRLPKVVRDQFYRFDPAGELSVRVAFDATAPEDAEPAERLHVELNLIDASISYHRHPYRLQQGEGLVSITPAEVSIDVKGFGPGAGADERGVPGTFTLKGTISPPGEGAAVNLLLIGRNVPVDDRLRGAMNEWDWPLFDAVFHKESFRRLVDRGVVDGIDRVSTEQPVDSPVISSGAPERHGEALPRFDLGGRADAVIRIRRPFGLDADYANVIELSLDGANLLAEPWPYPLLGCGGVVRMSPGLTEVDNVEVVGPTGARGRLNGRVYKDYEADHWVPEVVIEDAMLPVDPVLLAALPDEQAAMLDRLGLSANLLVNGGIIRNGVGDIDFPLNFKAMDGVLAPGDVDFEIDELAVEGTLSRRTLAIDQIRGRLEDAEVDAAVRAWWGSHDIEAADAAAVTDRFEIAIGVNGLVWNRALLDAITKPPRMPGDDQADSESDSAGSLIAGLDVLRSIQDKYEPRAVLDVAWRSQGAVDALLPGGSLTIKPKSLRVMRPEMGGNTSSPQDRPRWLQLTEMGGTAVLTGGVLVFDQLSGKHRAGDVSVSGSLDTQSGTTRLDIGGRGAFGDGVADLSLPEGLKSAINAVEPRGRYVLHDIAFHKNVEPSTGDSLKVETWDVGGVVDLIDVDLKTSLPLTGIDGRVEFGVKDDGGGEGAVWETLRVEAAEGAIMGRPLRDIVVTAGHSGPVSHGELTLDTAEGFLSEGRLQGRGMFRWRSPQLYGLELNLREAQASTLVIADDSESSDTQAAGARAFSQGLVDASLSVEGQIGSNVHRRGRGQFEMENVVIFENPLALAALTAAGIQVPEDTALSRVRCDYQLRGTKMFIDTLAFQGDAIQLVGGGSIDLESGAVDLLLFAAPPERGSRLPLPGPLVDLLNTLRDELVCVEVKGTIAEPQAQPTSFRGFRETWAAIFTRASN